MRHFFFLAISLDAFESPWFSIPKWVLFISEVVEFLHNLGLTFDNPCSTVKKIHQRHVLLPLKDLYYVQITPKDMSCFYTCQCLLIIVSGFGRRLASSQDTKSRTCARYFLFPPTRDGTYISKRFITGHWKRCLTS